MLVETVFELLHSEIVAYTTEKKVSATANWFWLNFLIYLNFTFENINVKIIGVLINF